MVDDGVVSLDIILLPATSFLNPFGKQLPETARVRKISRNLQDLKRVSFIAKKIQTGIRWRETHLETTPLL